MVKIETRLLESWKQKKVGWKRRSQEDYGLNINRQACWLGLVVCGEVWK